jgi:virulence factor Mce-like protein
MSASKATAGRALVRQRVGGLVFLVVLIGLVSLSVAFYNKAFTPTVQVTLEADRAGNQLTPPADVKVDGVIVGEARAVKAGPDGARITLALQPEAARTLPGNLQARLLPKTLFGEKYVELVRPERPAGQLRNGSVIPQDRSTTAVETEKALNDLLPVLRTLKPEVLSTTLNRLSSALRGRGDQIGANLQLTRDYLAQFNPQIPTLGQDMAGLADFADNVNAAEPDIIRLLDNLSAVNRNLVSEQQQLDTFLRSSTSVSGTLREFLRENEQRFVQLPAVSRGPLDTYAAYAPEFPCLANGLAQSAGFIADTFGNLQPGLQITLEFTRDRGGYTPRADEPRYLDDRRPDCFGLPDPQVPAPDVNFRDGYRDTPASGGASGASSASYAPASFSTASAYRSTINAAVAPALGTDAASVPGVARLLYGPVAGGHVPGSRW